MMTPLPAPPALTASQLGQQGYLVDTATGLIVAVIGGFQGSPPAGTSFVASDNLGSVAIGKPPPS